MGNPGGVECGSSEAFADVLILGLGHLQLLSLPKGQEFVSPGELTPGHLTPTVLVSHVVENVICLVKQRFCCGIAN